MRLWIGRICGDSWRRSSKRIPPSRQLMHKIETVLEQRKILLCLGGGGVGKTTVSAALALAAALRGRRTGLLTIDPAKRLKDALGMPDLGSEPTRVALEEIGVAPSGELTAM